MLDACSLARRRPGGRPWGPAVCFQSALVEVFLPFFLELLHRRVDRLLPHPDGLQGLGEEVAAGIDGEFRCRRDRYLADGGELHAFDEGAAHRPGMSGGLVVGTSEDRLPGGGATALGGP